MRLNRRLSQFLAFAPILFVCWLLDAYLGDYLRYLFLTLLVLGAIVRAVEPSLPKARVPQRN
jgi:hypothetical protein